MNRFSDYFFQTEILKKENILNYHVKPNQYVAQLRIDYNLSGETNVLDCFYGANEYIEKLLGYSVNYKNVVIKIKNLESSSDKKKFIIPYEKFININYLSGDTQLLDYNYKKEANYISFEIVAGVKELELSYNCGYPDGYCPFNITNMILIKTNDLYENETTSTDYSNGKSNDVINNLAKPYKKTFIV
jgi:hypothetical protein